MATILIARIVATCGYSGDEALPGLNRPSSLMTLMLAVPTCTCVSTSSRPRVIVTPLTYAVMSVNVDGLAPSAVARLIV